MRELARVLRPDGRMVLSVPYNPLKRAEIFAAAGVYGPGTGRSFFQRVYDEDWLQERLLTPSGLQEVDRVLLGEPGIRLSRAYYDRRGPFWKAVRLRAPVGPLLALAAPRFFRETREEDFTSDDWNGVPAVIVLEHARSSRA